MAKFGKFYYLITCFVIATCKPTNNFQKTVSQIQVDNGSVKTVSHSQLTTYSYAGYSQFNVNNIETKLYDLMANLFRNLRHRLPVIYIDPKVFFGPYFNGPPYPGFQTNTPSNVKPEIDYQNPANPSTFDPNKPAGERTTQRIPYPSPQDTYIIPDTTTRSSGTTRIIPTTRRTQQTRRTQATSTNDPLEFTSQSNDNDDDDDYVRPIVLRDAKSLENEVFDQRSRNLPDVEHGSVQAGE